MKIHERQRPDTRISLPTAMVSSEESRRASARERVAEITGSMPLVPSLPILGLEALDRENDTEKHLLRALFRNPIPDFLTAERTPVEAEDTEVKLSVEVDDFVWADLVKRATAPDDQLKESGQFGTRELEAHFRLNSFDPGAQTVIKIIDDNDNPANHTIDLFDLPPRWKKVVEKVTAEEGQEEKAEKAPLGERLKGNLKKAIQYVNDGLQPELMPGAEIEAILETQEPLTEYEIKVLLSSPNKQLASLFLTLCMSMQNPTAPILQPEMRTRPVNPAAEQLFDEGVRIGTIDLQSLAQQVINIVNLTPKAKASMPVEKVDKLSEIVSSSAEANKEENWNQRGAILPNNLGPTVENASYRQTTIVDSLEEYKDKLVDYKKAAEITGVPWVLLASINIREGISGSAVSGRQIGKHEPDVNPEACAGPYEPGKPIIIGRDRNGNALCGFKTFLDSAIYAGNLLKDKVGGDLSTPAQIAKALTRYNGGGNRNYGRTDYGFARRFIGDDDPYVTNLVDEKHGGEGYMMYVIYCEDGVPYTKGCPRNDYRPGVMAIARWIMESGKFN